MKVIPFIKYSHLFNKELPLNTAIEIMCNYGILNTVNLFSRIDLTLGHDYDAVLKAQIPLLTRKLACSDVVEKIKAYLNKPTSTNDFKQYVVFHPNQILNAVKLCLQHCRVIERVVDNQPFEELVKALLIVNDHLVPVDMEKKLAKKEIELIKYIVMNALFHRLENEKNLIGRWQEMIFKSYKQISPSDPDYLDADGIFKASFGFTPREFFAFCFGLYSFWITRLERQIDKGVIALDSNRLLIDFDVDTDKYKRIMDDLSAPIKWYTAQLTNPEFDPFDFLPLRKKPILSYKTQLFCLSKKLLFEKMTSGIYHMFFSCFKDDQSKKHFFRFMGKVYQNYITNILDKIFNKPGIAVRFFGSIKYRVGKQGLESCDGIIDYGDKLVLLEIKTKLFTHEFLAYGIEEEFKSTLKEIIYDGAYQIDRTIRHYKKNLFSIDGIDHKRIKKYYPIIMALQPIPIDPYIYKYIKQGLKKQKLLEFNDIEPLEVISTYGLENIVAMIDDGTSITDLIDDKHKNIGDIMSNIDTYMATKYPHASVVPSYIDDAYKDAVKQINEFWKPRNAE
jgi:hypothetical protein